MSDPQQPDPLGWPEQVEKIVADRAYTLNYEDGLQCRFAPIRSEGGVHTVEIFLETSHSGDPFDLLWFVKCGDDASVPIRFEVVAPDAEGAVLWRDDFATLDRLRRNAEALPIFIRGYFAGRKAGLAAASAKGPAARSG